MNSHIIVFFGTESGNVLPLRNEGEMGKSFPGKRFLKVSIRQYTGMRSQKSASTMVARLWVAVGGPGGLTEYIIIL